MQKLNELQIDALKEIGTIGAGSSATSLSTLLNKRVRISVPEAKIFPIEHIPEIIGKPEDIMVAVIFEVSGDVNGLIMLLFSCEEAKKIAEIAIQQQINDPDLNVNEIAVSAIKEIGNITTGAYLNAIAQITKLRLKHSIPNYASDMLLSIMDVILIKLAAETKDTLVIETEICCETEADIKNKKVQGYMLFISDKDGLNLMLKTLGLKKNKS